MQVIRLFRRTCWMLAALPAIAVMAGCDEIDQMNQNAGQRPVAAPPGIVDAPGNAPSTPATPANAPASTGGQTVEIVTNQAAQPAAQPVTAPPTSTAPTILEKPAGQGVQGQGYGGGIVTEPVHQYFAARDRITFDIQIPKQLQTWKAMNNNRNPRNVDEYKKEILAPCGIYELPELPAGKQYIYDAKTGQLMVQTGGPTQ